MSDEVTLDEGLKAQLVDLEAKLKSADHFTVLGVAIGADPPTVKAAFFQLSKKLHPDKYFRKNLGEVRPRLEAVFKALSKAHQTLTHPEKREAYLAANPHLRPPPPEPVRRAGVRMQWQKSDLAAAMAALKDRK
jgi:DnaJ-domain-containing protein 1